MASRMRKGTQCLRASLQSPVSPRACARPSPRTTLAVSWNCRNLVTEAYTLRPHSTADTMEEKELSSSRMSAASLRGQVVR